MSTNKLRIKLLFDKKEKKVLFAEAGKDVVDFLFYLLSLPLASVIKLLSDSNKNMVGCLNNLYKSIENLDKTYIQLGQSMDLLLNPSVSLTEAHLLLPLIQPIQTTLEIKIYRCLNSSHDRYFVKNPNLTCPHHEYLNSSSYKTKLCGLKMSCLDVPNEGYESSEDEDEDEDEDAEFIDVNDEFIDECDPSIARTKNCVGFVNGLITYMIMDDLMVLPMSTISTICVLNQFKIKDVSNLEEMVVDLGKDEGLKILEASLKGKEVLTQVFI